MAEPLTTAKLNELLVKVYERRILRELYGDPTKPWLPESYWREEYEKQQAAQEKAAKLIQDAQTAEDVRALRAYNDRKLQETVTVADILEEGIPSLQGDNRDLRHAGWGSQTMRTSGNWAMKPTPGSHQPTYDFECCQCSRPITAEGRDHAGRYACDHATLDPATSGCHDHVAKPWHGEEEEDDDDDE